MQAGVQASEENSPLALFLKALAEEGRAVVWPKPLEQDLGDAAEVLRQIDRIAREELALEPPGLSLDAALWAAWLAYHLCQFTVCRDIGAERVAAICQEACPTPRSPETDWSVDLTLRHLPRLFQLARHLSEGDPLVQHLRQIASAWPLSSVGVAGLADLAIESFIGHPALRRLYLDRIVAAEDISRLNDSRVSDSLRVDLGIHHELAPTIASRLYPVNS
ncbi:MAG TPA: hypothetical protein VFZ59_08625 [Verrucomicrobiae bacterium]|nr:hypothetical protein [Verrucomicrobiae bacterium]